MPIVSAHDASMLESIKNTVTNNNLNDVFSNYFDNKPSLDWKYFSDAIHYKPQYDTYVKQLANEYVLPEILLK